MKKLLIGLSTLSLLATPAISLKGVISTNSQKETLTNEINVATLIQKYNQEKLGQKNEIFDAGRNDYEYYFGYHVIFFSHDVTQQITDIMAGTGSVAGIIAIISYFIPSIVGGLVAVVAGIIAAQWLAWNISGYDYGAGVAIAMIGFAVPQYVVNVWSQ